MMDHNFWFGMVVVGALLGLAWLLFEYLLAPTADPNDADELVDAGHWEAVEDEHFWRVRWSVPDFEGRYLWVRHYSKEGGGSWAELACERNVREFNETGRSPWEWDNYR